jgi:4-aminobutyrate aminotransferase/(S)-3-amino-2-methylpropionate transaminase
MELVTGEGGFIPAPKKYVQGLAKICRDNGILFIADEVQTGFGRTGKNFASEHYGLQPDLITMAKSLGGGLPLGAVTGRAEIMDSVHVGGLGGTYGGNPLACVASLASIDVMRRKKLVQRSRLMGEKIRRRFEQFHRKYDIVGDARGLGSMRAIELVKDRRTREPAPEKAAELVKRCYETGLLILSAGVFSNVIRTLMPLTISDGELHEGLDILESNLSGL